MKYSLIALICLTGLASAIPVEVQQEVPELSCELEPPAPPAPPPPPSTDLEPPNCEPGKVLVDCDCVDQFCPAGQVLLDGECVKQGCPEGQIRLDGDCVDQGKAGKSGAN
ncbi:hypothetical protein BBAD15_g10999 [Beauveria bassiana D1-5]|uniref:Uncharacterized protein n=1 Tax=Beauveria bassiana D1-5 TaxID=1245745 RepID=A0A0A2V7E0_BEABA|nr:hypothetical protein BBAD15_g10999 [Beauveria bassiana D1-5]